MKVFPLNFEMFCKQFTDSNSISMSINSNKKSGMGSSEFQLLIKNDRKVLDLQSEFNSRFPYLKIEFFKVPHKIGEGTPKKLVYSKDKLISDCRASKNEGLISISEEIKVSTIENEFYKNFGLSVQVFRKAGNVWLETSATDHWSLKAQNIEGAELSK